MDKAAVRAWLARFDTVRTVERNEARRGAASAHWSLDASLPMIERARAALADAPALLRRRDSEDATVRATWIRLRAQICR